MFGVKEKNNLQSNKLNYTKLLIQKKNAHAKMLHAFLNDVLVGSLAVWSR